MTIKDILPSNSNNGKKLIKQAAAIAATHSFGVVGMTSKYYSPCPFSRANQSKGVYVKFLADGRAQIDLYVIMEFGIRLLAAAESLIDSVKYNVEKNIGADVAKINVHVKYVRA
ncbi:MAG: Asp23/Gls24 family envelope stress response protein [Eubacteriaceae bacterium]|nr:Asp23/Gls24 family envelope stress response protein [Eubacteriaceae bacterium]